jgi:hypothetical protein
LDIVDHHLALMGDNDVSIDAILAWQGASAIEKERKGQLSSHVTRVRRPCTDTYLAAEMNAWFQDMEAQQAKSDFDLAVAQHQKSMECYYSCGASTSGQQWPADLLLSGNSGVSISKGVKPNQYKHEPTGRSSPRDYHGQSGTSFAFTL